MSLHFKTTFILRPYSYAWTGGFKMQGPLYYKLEWPPSTLRSTGYPDSSCSGVWTPIAHGAFSQ